MQQTWVLKASDSLLQRSWTDVIVCACEGVRYNLISNVNYVLQQNVDATHFEDAVHTHTHAHAHTQTTNKQTNTNTYYYCYTI
jgi:hypothetical protein